MEEDKEAEHCKRYDRRQTTVEATHIMSDTRSVKLETLIKDDDNELLLLLLEVQ